MAWYRTGNVAVAASDTVVAGTGTLFATHVRVGDGFVGPDGRMYEVTNIASETVLSIFPAYRGATASGQDYSIIPVQGYPKQLSDRAGVLVGQVGQLPGRIDDIDDVLAALGSAAGADMPAGVTEFGTAAGAQLSELLTKAGNLAGLVDKAQSRLNLGVIQTLAGEVFNTDNCVVINNANGIAARFENRLQICIAFSNLDLTGMNWVAYGAGRYVELGAILPYPASFKSSPILGCAYASDAYTARSAYFGFVASTATTHINTGSILFSPNPTAVPSPQMYVSAVLAGYWK